MVFEIGAKVIYPSHGVAEIVGRESRAINGATETYLVLSVLQPGWGTRSWMKVSLPEDRAEGLGVRAAISREDASDVIELLGIRTQPDDVFPAGVGKFLEGIEKLELKDSARVFGPIAAT